MYHLHPIDTLIFSIIVRQYGQSDLMSKGLWQDRTLNKTRLTLSFQYVTNIEIVQEWVKMKMNFCF